MTSTTAKEDTATIVDHANWTEGDFALISADNVRFRVRSRTLFAISDVLADMAEVAGDKTKELQLSDPELESSEVIDHFLGLAIHATLPQVSEYAPESEQVEIFQSISKVLQLMDKYDCTTLSRQLNLCVVEQMSKRTLPPQMVFAIGAITKNIDLCLAALTRACELCVNSEVRYRPCPADPGRLSLRMWNLIPTEWAWAWTNAWSEGKGAAEHYSVNGRHDLHSVLSNFEVSAVSLKRGAP